MNCPAQPSARKQAQVQRRQEKWNDSDLVGHTTKTVSLQLRLSCSWETRPGPGVVNDLVNALLNSAKETINFVEAQEPDVGEIDYYAVMRKDFPYDGTALMHAYLTRDD